jgi:Flp pilus assembly protein TadG
VNPAVPQPGPSGCAVGERGGSASVEAALLIGALALLVGFAIAGGRLVAAEAGVDHAAHAAARVASLHRDPTSADRSARAAADDSLATQNLRCATLDVALDTDAVDGALGVAGSVTVTVRCAVAWSDLGLPSGSTGPVVEAVAVSTVDRWRERP